MEVRLFKDRAEAGERLAERLKDSGAKRPLVLAIPRGGVPLGATIAQALECPLDTLVVRKVGTLFSPEFAVGALAPHDVFLLDEGWLKASGVSRASVDRIVGTQRQELRRLSEIFHSGTYAAGYVPDMVVLVDDGVATALSARAAIMATRIRYKNARIIFAAPVSVGGELNKVREIADEVVCIAEPKGLYAVSQAYKDFPQVSEAEVLKILKDVNKKDGTVDLR